MNREILFRGFYLGENGTQIAVVNGKEYKGEWIVGAATYHSEGYQWLLVDDYTLTETLGTGSYAVIPETVGQFTGLTDRNGKKIFEGDKVVGDVGNGYNPVPRLLQRIGIVQYGNKSPGFTLKIINRFGVNENGESDFCDFQGCGVSFGAFGNMEVIGNAFEVAPVLEDNND